MAISFIQRVGTVGSNATVSSITITIGASITTAIGNTLVLNCRGGGNNLLTSVSDSKGNTWVVDLTAAPNSATVLGIASCYLTSQLVTGDTITATFAAASAGKGVAVHEFSGIAGTSRKDVSVVAGGSTNTTGSVGPTSTLNYSNELVYTAVSVNGSQASWTQPAGYSQISAALGSFNYTSAAYLIDADKTAKSVTWSWPSTGIWVMGIVTYRPSISTNFLLLGVG